MTSSPKKTRREWYTELLHLLLRPIAVFCVKNALPIQVVTEALKLAFVQAAKSELERRDERINISRIGVVTGLVRREVVRLSKESLKTTAPATLLSKVIGSWEQDSSYTTKAGCPRILDPETDFRSLVQNITQDVHPSTVLFELERAQLVERTPRGLRLAKTELVSVDPSEAFEFLSRDLGELIYTVDENLFSDQAEKNLHALTEYDNVRKDKLPQIKKWLLKEGRAFHQKARDYLSQFDLDVNPKSDSQGGARVTLGVFGRASDEHHE